MYIRKKEYHNTDNQYLPPDNIPVVPGTTCAEVGRGTFTWAVCWTAGLPRGFKSSLPVTLCSAPEIVCLR